MKKQLTDRALQMALTGFQQECMCPDDNQRSALEHSLLHMYEREPDFHDLINKLVDQTMGTLPLKDTNSFKMAVDAYFDQDPSTALKSIPEERHLKVVDDEFDNDDEDEDQEISLDSFTGMMGQSGFLLDGAVPAADFTDLIAKLVAGDAKAIEEYDYQQLLTGSCDSLDQFPTAFASFLEKAVTMVEQVELLSRIIVKQVKTLVTTYPALYKELVQRFIPVCGPAFETMVSELMQIELDYYWILHPPVGTYTSPLISEVVARKLLGRVEQSTLAKMFLKRQTRLILIREFCEHDTLQDSSPHEALLIRQAIFYLADFRRAGGDRTEQIIRKRLKENDQLMEALSATLA